MIETETHGFNIHAATDYEDKKKHIQKQLITMGLVFLMGGDFTAVVIVFTCYSESYAYLGTMSISCWFLLCYLKFDTCIGYEWEEREKVDVSSGEAAVWWAKSKI